jgi:hypothetical protein
MPAMSQALHFLILMVAGWWQRRMEAQREYLITDNALYKKSLGRAGLRLTDAQRRLLAINAKAVGRKDLARITTVATPDTILRWYRQLVAISTTAVRSADPADRAFTQISPS